MSQELDHPAMADDTVFERRMKIVSMRNGRVTYTQIAKHFKISTTQARKDHDAGLREYAKDTVEKRIAQVDSMIRDVIGANYQAAMAADPDAGKLVISGADRLAKLYGLDMPSRLSIGVGTDVEFSNRLSGLFHDLGLEPIKELRMAAAREILEAEVVSEEKHAFDSNKGEFPFDDPSPPDDEPPEIDVDEKHAFDSKTGDEPTTEKAPAKKHAFDSNKGDAGPDDRADDADDWSNL